jgi:cytidylate kinase
MAGLYGAGTTVIGPRVAEQLGVPFLDREVLAGVAERLGVPESAIEAYDADYEQAPRSPVRRFLDSLGQPVTADTGPPPDEEAHRIRSATTAYLTEATVHGAVVVGRGGMVVLCGVPGALHVRLDGPRDARVRHAMELFDIDRPTAERRRRDNDRMRIRYVRRTYGVDLDDPDLYHLRLDSTVLDPETCVELIVTAARARTRGKAPA